MHARGPKLGVTAAAAALAAFLATSSGMAEVTATAEESGGARPAAPGFVLPRSAAELTFPVAKLEAAGAAAYLVTSTPIAPPPSAYGWKAAPPATLTAEEPGVHDYYAWVKDAAGNVSPFAVQTVDVRCTKITVGPKGRDFTNFADAVAEIARRGNPAGCVIEADAGEYPSWRSENEYKGRESFLKNIVKASADNLTIRGMGGRAHLAYECRGAVSKDRWTVPPGGTQHGSVIVQAARNLRLENVEVSGGCEATSGNGAGLWVEPAGVGTVVRDCFFHDNDNGILTSRIPSARVIVMNSEFRANGAPGPFAEGQNHNLYVGEVAELVFMFNWSHASQRGQLLKSRAARNHVLYNRLTDEGGSNYPIDLPYGGESYVIGNLVQMSATNRNGTMINYGREVVMNIAYRNGGPEPLKDRAEVTDERTGRKYRLHYSLNHGASGKWESRDRASRCSLRLTEADGPDFKPGDRLTYGQDSSVEIVSAEWSWAGAVREIRVCSNTFVNECNSGYGQYLLRAHPDTKLVLLRNNLIVDLRRPGNVYRLWPDASKTVREKPVVEEDDLWVKAEPGLVDLAGCDYSLQEKAAGVIDKGAPPGSANGMSLAPVYQYVHPCKAEARPEDGKPDLGAYELRRPQTKQQPSATGAAPPNPPP